MNALLDWFSAEEAPAAIVLAILLNFVGSLMKSDNRVVPWSRRIAAGAFLLWTGLGIHADGIWSAGDCVVIILRAMLAGAIVHGLATTVLPAGALLYRELKPEMTVPLPAENLPEPELDPEPQPPPAPPPLPLPTPEERAAEALARYEAKLTMIEKMPLDAVEMKSAKEQVKKQYLKNLDDIIK